LGNVLDTEVYTTEKAYPQYKFTSAPDFPLHFHLSDSVYEAERFIEIETPEPFVFSGIKFQEREKDQTTKVDKFKKMQSALQRIHMESN
jgi:hypothetical protein